MNTKPYGKRRAPGYSLLERGGFGGGWPDWGVVGPRKDGVYGGPGKRGEEEGRGARRREAGGGKRGERGMNCLGGKGKVRNGFYVHSLIPIGPFVSTNYTRLVGGGSRSS